MNFDITLAEPDLGNLEKEYLLDAFESGWISSSGRFLDLFESEMKNYLGVDYALATTNGTTALHLAMLALGISPGDEVIIPAVTYVAVANAVKYAGGTPVIVDVTPGDLNIDPEMVVGAISPKTKAIVAVHLYGVAADLRSLLKICKDNGLFLIEDCAEAHGASINGKIVGSFGDVSVFSFYGNKIISTGEGGLVATNNEQIYNKIKLLRGQGMDPVRRYWFPIIGYNYRMTNIAAALGCAQIKRIEEILSLRQIINSEYQARFLTMQVQLAPSANAIGSVPWLRNVFINESSSHNRDEIMEKLSEVGIESRPVFIPIYDLPPYADPNGKEKFPISHLWANKGISLPLHTKLTISDVNRVCDEVSLLVN
jgi:perosamine synthetase